MTSGMRVKYEKGQTSPSTCSGSGEPAKSVKPEKPVKPVKSVKSGKPVNPVKTVKGVKPEKPVIQIKC